MKDLENLFLNTFTKEIEIAGIKFIPRSHRNFFIEHNGIKKIVKKTELISFKRPFFIFEEIPNIKFETNGQTFILKNNFFEIYDIDQSLKYADISCFKHLINIYTFSDKINFIKNNFVDIQHCILESSHTYIHSYGVSLGDIAHKLLENASYDLSACKKGFFHGDLHYGNILQGNEKIHLIDFDSVFYSYTVLNLAQCFSISVLQDYGHKKISREQVVNLRKDIISNLEKSDAHYFDFFVSVMSYFWMIRAIPNIITLKDRKQEFIKSLQNSFTFILSLQDGNYYPALGANCLKNGKVIFNF